MKQVELQNDDSNTVMCVE